MSFDEFTPVWWFILFCVMVWISVEIPRRIAEKIWPAIKDKMWERDIVLVVVPPFLGMGYALVMRKYPFLVDQSEGVRVALGLTGGFFSSWVVRVVKLVLKKKTGVDLDTLMEDPPK